MMTSFWAAWTITLAFVVPPRHHEKRQDIEHRVLQTMIDDEDAF